MQHFDRLVERHGLHYAQTWQAWVAMHRRVKTRQSYADRAVDPAWHKFKNFLKDMGIKPASHLSLDRIDNSLGYTKQNCRWATYTQQSRNRGDYNKLSELVAAEIREIYNLGFTQQAIAEDYEIAQAQVSEVILNKRWA